MEGGAEKTSFAQYEDDDEDDEFGFKQQQAQHRQFLDNEVQDSSSTIVFHFKFSLIAT